MLLDFKIAGQGEVITLIHGFCADESIWDTLVEELRDYKIILVSLPGHAQKPANSPFTIESLSDEIETFYQENNIEKSVIIGHSMGGYIAAAYTQKYPNRVQGMLFFHSSMYADTAEKKENRTKSIEFVQKYGAKILIQELVVKLFSDKYKEENPTVVSDRIKSALQMSDETILYCLHALRDRTDRASLAQVNKPIAYIIGKDDKLFSAQNLLAEACLHSNTHILLANKSGHLAMIEEPKICNSFIMNFIHYCHTHSII